MSDEPVAHEALALGTLSVYAQQPYEAELYDPSIDSMVTVAVQPYTASLHWFGDDFGDLAAANAAIAMPVYITFASKRNDRGWEYSWLQPHRDDPESIYYDRTTPNELMDDLHHLYDTLHEILQRKHRDRKRQPKMQLPDQYEFHDVLFACGHVLRVPIGTYNSEMWFWREFFKRCVTPQMAEDMPASFTARLNAVYERTRTNSQRGHKRTICRECKKLQGEAEAAMP